jgi:hypothetical protein
VFRGQMRNSQLYRRALRLDVAHVSIFVVRAVMSGHQASHDARSARADALVAVCGLSLAVTALLRDARTPVVAGLLVNTTGCVVTLMSQARIRTSARGTPWLWTTHLLIGGDAVSVAYLAAGAGASTARARKSTRSA